MTNYYELKRCPLCKLSAGLVNTIEFENGFVGQVGCVNCNRFIMTGYFLDLHEAEESAIKIWNNLEGEETK